MCLRLSNPPPLLHLEAGNFTTKVYISSYFINFYLRLEEQDSIYSLKFTRFYFEFLRFDFWDLLVVESRFKGEVSCVGTEPKGVTVAWLFN